MSQSLDEISHIFLEEIRLSTFKTWPFDDDSKCNRKRMAEAGFYKSGTDREIDLVTCFLCGKELDGWETDDDPWEEHKSHAKNCLFAQIGKPEENLTVAEYLEINRDFLKNTIVKNKDKVFAILNDLPRDFETKSKVI